MAKEKQVHFQIIPATEGSEPHLMMHEIRDAHHPKLAGALIGLAWKDAYSRDPDGRVVLGKCIKVADLQKEFSGYDFIIVLNREFWESTEVTDAQKRALIDHELCHATIAEDEDGEPKRDERGRQVYRIRKHDLEEFREIVARHGIWKADIEAFAEEILRHKAEPTPAA